jgi:hypothetical protein
VNSHGHLAWPCRHSSRAWSSRSQFAIPWYLVLFALMIQSLHFCLLLATPTLTALSSFAVIEFFCSYFYFLSTYLKFQASLQETGTHTGCRDYSIIVPVAWKQGFVYPWLTLRGLASKMHLLSEVADRESDLFGKGYMCILTKVLKFSPSSWSFKVTEWWKLFHLRGIEYVLYDWNEGVLGCWGPWIKTCKWMWSQGACTERCLHFRSPSPAVQPDQEGTGIVAHFRQR